MMVEVFSSDYDDIFFFETVLDERMLTLDTVRISYEWTRLKTDMTAFKQHTQTYVHRLECTCCIDITIA